jgi:transposase
VRLTEGYSYYAATSNYGDVNQRWVLFFSEQAYRREVVTLNKNIQKESDEYKKLWWHLSNEEFSCEEDAQISIKKLTKKMKYHEVNTDVVEFHGYVKPGRPGKQDKPEMKGYKIQYTLQQNKNKIEEEKERKGRFILSTNQMDKNALSDADILMEYKAQSSTEGGFKFIKDDTFELDSVFLKTPSRISALMMVMTLCLMVYGVSQYDLWLALKKSKKTLPNQKRKPTDAPRMKWIYYLFTGVHELTVNIGDTTKTLVINMNELRKEIIGYFGGTLQEFI